MNATVYVGTYTQTGRGQPHRPEGIYQYRFDPADGTLSLTGAAKDTLNPSFLAVHPTRRYLFAVNELGQGMVSAFGIAASSGELSFINSQPTNGAAPCYVNCDPTGRWLMIANYSSGSIAVYPIAEDGSLAEMSDFIQHEGQLGPNQRRQEHAHAHSIRFDPTGRFVLAADLGLDEVRLYRLDGKTGKLMPNDPPAVRVSPGAGPRHVDFNHHGHFVYIANELDSTVTACTWDSQHGVIDPIQTVSTLPTGFTGENTVADIHLTPNGAFLYVSNRGHHSLAAYTVNRHTGMLYPAGFYATHGEVPRNFAIDPSGAFILAANQDSNNLVVLRIDPAQGSLEKIGQDVPVPSPVCVQFL
jgi:6-phosphogluconolactonase